jgi:hypothetical protein
MTYKDLKEKRDNLKREIDAMLNARFEMDFLKAKNINEVIEAKKKQYIFYNNLLKNYGKFKEGKNEKDN